MLEKANGIVLETKAVGEADSLITLLLDSGFKETFLLKGIRKTKRREILATELGSFVNLVYYHKKNQEIRSVKEIHLIERFEKLKSYYSGFITLSAILELVNKFIPKNLEQKKVFELLLKALEILNELGVSNIVVPFFKLRLLQILGYAPREFECISCSKNIFQSKGAMIYSNTLEIFCAECKTLEENHIEILLLMKKMSFTSYKNLLQQEFKIEILKQIDSILNRFINSQLGLELKTQSFVF